MYAIYTRPKEVHNISKLQNKFIRARKNGKPISFKTMDEVNEYLKGIDENVYDIKINVVKK